MKEEFVVRNQEGFSCSGSRQEEWMTYDEVFAPVARLEAIRIFLAFASYMGFKFDFANVKTASTPIETQKPLVKDKEASDVDVHLYRVTPKIPHLSAVREFLGKSTKAGCQFPWQEDLNFLAVQKQTIVATSTTEQIMLAAASCSWAKTHSWMLFKIHTDDNVADLLTKAFDVSSLTWSPTRRSLKGYGGVSDIIELSSTRFSQQGNPALKDQINKLKMQANLCAQEVCSKQEVSLQKENHSSRDPSTSGRGVSTDFEKLSTDRPIVSTDGFKVSTDMQVEGAEDQVKGTDEHNEGTEDKNEGTEDQTEEEIATQTSTQTPTFMIFGDDETIAKVLLNMSQAKAVSKEKVMEVGIIDPKDKGRRRLKRRMSPKSESDGISLKLRRSLSSLKEMKSWLGKVQRRVGAGREEK
ncbi:hypothetical protein Tco_0923527 [Tanacetum coccineum]|uniref:Reverse transcriptase Ty1/copia-type domain-containing protein n=1 Tax=Tanacetum coccineum TaxID=301880 RepID=A0ABQ5D3M8_9ASTR